MSHNPKQVDNNYFLSYPYIITLCRLEFYQRIPSLLSSAISRTRMQFASFTGAKSQEPRAAPNITLQQLIAPYLLHCALATS
jgi:hypothetical protein